MGLILDSVRALLAAEPPARPGAYAEVRDSVLWRRAGEVALVLPYRVRRSQDDAGLLMVEAPATEGGPLLGPVYPLEARPSNLGRGLVWLWRCPACQQLARLLYRGAWGRWECRRCNPVSYQSSRESDGRVSRLLAEDDAAWAGLLRRAAAPPLSGASGGELAAAMRGADGLLLAIKAADRLGLGVTRPPRDRVHAGQGRPWSAARRAALESEEN